MKQLLSINWILTQISRKKLETRSKNRRGERNQNPTANIFRKNETVMCSNILLRLSHSRHNSFQ